jgi:hypothetical protein
LPLCTSFKGDGYNNSLLAFDDAMKDVKNTKDCVRICLPNCDETTYEYTVDTTELNTEELCKNEDTRKVVLMPQFLIYYPTIQICLKDCFESVE